ncbi:hypothetical protein PPYR_10364 [Photinus pyralis]|uniref:15-hydroxyprostaglandin dehydrogenase n=1 Tax=Photinus pyralis TaxID=7054 RepID=A0A5N4AG74_PHOPY|nr:hypothetical protein PPYR_10364 [Photinus pyralis]
MFKLEGKVALITGGASGIGLSTVKELLANGLKAITVVDFNETAGQRVIEEVTEEFGANRAIFVKADVGNVTEFRGAFEATVEKFDNLDIVINNAGIMNEIEWEKMINTNINGTIHGCLLALDYLQRYRRAIEGVIINISSIMGLQTAGHTPFYNTTKHAIVGLGRSLGLHGHYESTAVKVITICPGCTATPLLLENMEERFSKKQIEMHTEVMKKFQLQSANNVARELTAIIKHGQSGSVWLIENDEPAYQVETPHYSDMRVPHS